MFFKRIFNILKIPTKWDLGDEILRICSHQKNHPNRCEIKKTEQAPIWQKDTDLMPLQIETLQSQQSSAARCFISDVLALKYFRTRIRIEDMSGISFYCQGVTLAAAAAADDGIACPASIKWATIN